MQARTRRSTRALGIAAVCAAALPLGVVAPAIAAPATPSTLQRAWSGCSARQDPTNAGGWSSGSRWPCSGLVAAGRTPDPPPSRGSMASSARTARSWGMRSTTRRPGASTTGEQLHRHRVHRAARGRQHRRRRRRAGLAGNSADRHRRLGVFFPGATADANSTGLAINAILAAAGRRTRRRGTGTTRSPAWARCRPTALGCGGRSRRLRDPGVLRPATRSDSTRSRPRGR